jgi:hypothetical protein
MSLDFAVLGDDGSPEKAVALSVDLHHKLLTAAAGLGLVHFRHFEDYYSDAEIAVSNLPMLAEGVAMLRARTTLAELQRFLDDLSGLIVYAMTRGEALHAIAD